MDNRVLIGYAPTRRRIFSVDDALKYKKLIRQRLEQLNIELVDIDDINEEGLLSSADHVDAVIDKFRAAKVNAVFFPHCNFGSEHSCGKVARALNVPVLLWGPTDDVPEADGSRLRDTQCGLFATGKVMRRMGVPFTYMPICDVDSDAFERGFNNFVAAANVVKEFRKARILQIGTRPADFWTMMANEGELLERFGIQVFPITLVELADYTKKLIASDSQQVKTAETFIRENMVIDIPDEAVRRVASLKVAMRNLADQNGCNAAAIQCWDALQDILQIMPCTANSMLTDEGLPVACETDIHGAITSIIVQAAGMGSTPSFFVDWTIRHPDHPNRELLQHCGPWPISLAKEKPKITTPFAFDSQCPGSLSFELKGGEISLIRFDGDHGEYGVLLGKAHTVEGPSTNGTYVWIEVPNWAKVESMIVKGPYVHHAVGIHGNILPVVYEALPYLNGVRADFIDEDQERETKNFYFNVD